MTGLLHWIPRRPRAVLIAALLTSVVAGAVGAAPAQAAVPVVVKVAPLAVAAGHGITVTGTDLGSTTSVVFLGGDGDADDRPAASFLALGPTSLLVQVPREATSGPVQVTNDAGTSASSPVVTVVRPPVITELSASTVKGKDKLTITGTDLGGKPAVAIGGKKATIVGIPGATSLTVEVPVGLTGGPAVVRLTAAGGADTASVYIAPEIKGIAPAVGSTTGGYTAVLTGSGFTGADQVTFDGVPSTSVLPIGDKEVVVRVPAGTASLTGADVVVSTRKGDVAADASIPVKFGYQPVPRVTAVTPSWSPLDVPQEVTLSGDNLDAGTVVMLGVAILPTTPGPEGTLVFEAPAASKAAVVNLTVSNKAPNGIVHKTAVPFTYAGAPTVTKLAPASGPAGTAVFVTGTGFVAGTTAMFGDTVVDCTVVSAVSLSCVAPAVSGAVPVTVKTPVGTAPRAPALDVLFSGTGGQAPAPLGPAAPVVTGLKPAAAPIGASVSIAGSDLQRVSAVTFPTADGSRVAADERLLVAPNRLVVRVPAGAVSGEIQLQRATGAAVGSGAVRFTVVADLSVSSVSALADRSYAVVGGDTVVIRGTGLMAGSTFPLVTVGGVAASVLKTPTPTPTVLAVKVPAAAGGRAPVRVTTPYGSVVAPVDLFYMPDIKSIKTVPLPGPAGLRAMSITGTGFTGADQVTTRTGRLSAVTFGGDPSAEVVVMNDKTVYAVPSTQSALFDPLKVTTEHQAWSCNSAGVVTPLKLPLPTISGVSPDVLALGEEPAAVTITGTNLDADTVVRFGSATADVVSAEEDGTSIVVLPPSRPAAAKVSVSVTNTIHGQPYTGTLENGFAYLPVPDVTGLSPADGPAGTAVADVTITGTNLLANSIVRFGGKQASVLSAASDGTRLLVSPPTHEEAQQVDVTVTNLFDAQPLTTTYANGYAYTLAPASLTGLSVTTAIPGSQVTINGTGFLGVESVYFGDTEVPTFSVPGSTTILAVVPPTPDGEHGTTVPVRVINATGSPSTGDHTWTWDARPAVTGVTPRSAVVGEQPGEVTLSGNNLLPTTVVKFGASTATVVRASSDGSSLVVVPPARNSAASVSVSVSNTINGQPYSESLSSAFDYLPVPSLGVISPTVGPVGSLPGDVTINGHNLYGNTVVRFGDQPATVRSASSDGTRIVVSPPLRNSSGPVDVSVTNIYDTEPLSSVALGGYVYVLDAAVVSGLSLSTAPPGTEVTVTGSNFVGVTAVRFGSKPVPYRIANTTTMFVTVPETPSTLHGTTVPVSVVNGTGSPSTGGAAWAWDARPTIETVDPGSAVVRDQVAPVTITGTNLMPATVVKFGTAVATVVSAEDDGSSMVVVPPTRNTAGTVSVSVVNTISGLPYTATLTDAFRYLPVPSITGLSPAAGPINTAPDDVTITGRNLFSNTVVTFGGAAATVRSASADGTSLVVGPPTRTEGGPVDVRVSNLYDGQTLTATLTNGYGYALSPATVTGLSANTAAPGTSVTITGTNFAGVSKVSFGSTSVPFTVSNSSTIFVEVPNTPTGLFGSTVAVRVVNGTGTPSSDDHSWTWDARPTITSVDPGSAVAGLQPGQVTINGYNLLPGTVVRFGGVNATVVSADPDGSSMIVVPPTSASVGPVTVSAVNTINGTAYTGTLTNGFRYLPVPSVSNVSPATGATGRTPDTVTLTGRNLLVSSVVRFGDAPATVVSAAADGKSMVVTPPVRNEAGTVDLTVTNDYDGQKLVDTVTNGYTYALAAASVTGLSATTAVPGTQITITGTSFVGVSSVRLGATAVTFTVANSTTIYATVPVTPSGMQGTTVGVNVVNGTGNASTGDKTWTWDSKPMITSMAASTGAKGSTVRINGTGFTGTTAVRIGGTDVTGFTVVSDTVLDAVIPSTPSAGTVDVTVVARGLASVEPSPATANDWTWASIASVTTNSTRTAAAAAGTTVTVTGTGFTPGQTVVIEQSATNILDVSASVVVAADGKSFTFTMPTRPGGAGVNRTDKPMWVTNSSGTRSPDPGNGGHLITWA